MTPRTATDRPVGALCVRCGCRPAVPNRVHPHLATMFCGETCRRQFSQEKYRTAMRADANAIRRLANIKAVEGGPMLTAPELATLRRVLERLTGGFGGEFHLPSHKKDGRRIRRARRLGDAV